MRIARVERDTDSCREDRCGRRCVRDLNRENERWIGPHSRSDRLFFFLEMRPTEW